MNIQTPLTAPKDAKALYDRDFAEWLHGQAKALSARDIQKLDWENLAEEIRCMGDNLRRELVSRLRVLMIHVIKLRLSRSEGPRAGWRRTIRIQRTEIADLLENNPSLRRHLPDLPGRLFPDACAIALDALEDHEPALNAEYRMTAGTLDPESPETLLDRDWFPPLPE